jgi:hypothetical protein
LQSHGVGDDLRSCKTTVSGFVGRTVIDGMGGIGSLDVRSK